MNAEHQISPKRKYPWFKPPEHDTSELIERIGVDEFRGRIFGNLKSVEKDLDEIAKVLSEQSKHRFDVPYIQMHFKDNDVFDVPYEDRFLRFEESKPGVYRIEDISYQKRLGC